MRTKSPELERLCRAAAPWGVIVFRGARFTILTSRLIRMEWAEDGVFEDRATLSVVNRCFPRVEFRKEERANSLTLKTDYLTLNYWDDGKPFSKANLSVSFRMGENMVRWFPGKKDTGNLKGTARTLDGMDGDVKRHWKDQKVIGRLELGDGLLSKNGWAVLDDSTNTVLDAQEKDQPWVAPRPEGERRDLYFFGYGHAYKDALADGARLLGRQPLPPRFTLGYWWSRYWAYTEREMRELVEDFNRMNVPLDVLVVDMDWHLPGWTGYTWDRNYFPDPDNFLGDMRDQGIRVTLNLHPADGVGRHEERFEDMAKALGLDPKKVDRVPMDITDPAYMDAYFRVLHHPEEKRGVDFWWMDWQQGTKTAIPGLDPLPWINQLHWEDMEKNQPRRRPLIFSRYGGPGAGRYPIGFSGDTFATWTSLAFQPGFTATASNILYGYWSHDIGGHQTGRNVEPELYLRWVQFGVFSPVLRTHTTKNPYSDRRFQEYPSPYSRMMIEAVRRRYEMVPYIYTENRRCFDTAISLCRPMYYDWPEEKEAYRAKGQYKFGDSMIVAPVTQRSNPKDDMAPARVWLPEDDWFDTARGCFEKGGQIINRRYLIDEVPVFVRPGAVVPGRRASLRLNEASYKNLVITAYPGGDGSYDLYEDDGTSRDYLRGDCAWIPLGQRTTPKERIISIGKARGSYRGFARNRAVEIRLASAPPPMEVQAGGRVVPWTPEPSESGWNYDGEKAMVVIRIPSVDLTQGLKVRVKLDPKVPADAAIGLFGLLHQLDHVRQLLSQGSTWHPIHDQERLGAALAQAAAGLMRNPSDFLKVRERLHREAPLLPGILALMVRRHTDYLNHRIFVEKALALSRSMVKERL